MMQSWTGRLALEGVPISYTPDEDVAGLQSYASSQVDFASSEVEFAGFSDPTIGDARGYQYVPAVGAAITVGYNVSDASGHPLSSLQLTPRTVALIFTGMIATWADPAIAADNPGVVLPHQPIRVVYLAGRSGHTAHFYDFVAHSAPDIFDPWASGNGFPTDVRIQRLDSSPQFAPTTTAFNSTDKAAQFISSPAGAWSIGYMPHMSAQFYATRTAAIRNAAGVFTNPSARGTTAALAAATLRPDTSVDLSGVYDNADPDAYPISFSSYLVTPCASTPGFPTCNGSYDDSNTRLSVARFLRFVACEGQLDPNRLGYARLPLNLSQEIANAIGRLLDEPPEQLDASNCLNGPWLTGPRTLRATALDGAIELSWPHGGALVVDHGVSVIPAPGSGNCATGWCTTSSTMPQFSITDLPNGDYTITVVYVFGPFEFSDPSPPASARVGPQLMYQTIDVTRPEGTLVLSQRCSALPFDSALPDFDADGGSGDFDPSNPDLVPPYGGAVSPATRCTVNLSGPRRSHLVSVVTAEQRTVHDAHVTAGSKLATSEMASFVPNDVGQLVAGEGLPAGSRIESVDDGRTVRLSSSATATLDDAAFSVLGRTITGPAGAFAPSDTGKTVEGIQIPGGTVITSASSFPTFGSLADLSQPANHAATDATVRVRDEPQRPARFLTSGPDAGAYLEAIGKMAQVYVVDYRSVDAGWDVTGQVSHFCDGSGPAGGPGNLHPAPGPRGCLPGDRTFSGNQLGWSPKVRRFSGEPTMLVTSGHSVAAGGSLAAMAQTLASAAAGQGLGIARLDADLRLLIPVEVGGGDFQATMTLTVA